ncbi:MAG: hypothetical protein QME45_03225 [Clostridiales bacterium]|nr:hypothetical protein [Clostridiales bacterium]HBM81345.1 hypothetical protein [Clostridiaceae bacterium]
MKFFKKPDEMEMSINFKAMRLAWVFENIVLIVWTIISCIKEKGSFPITLMIILAQNIIFFGSKLYMAHKMTDDKNEE